MSSRREAATDPLFGTYLDVPGQTLAVEPGLAAVDVAHVEEAAEGGIFRGAVVGGHEDVMLGCADRRYPCWAMRSVVPGLADVPMRGFLEDDFPFECKDTTFILYCARFSSKKSQKVVEMYLGRSENHDTFAADF